MARGLFQNSTHVRAHAFTMYSRDYLCACILERVNYELTLKRMTMAEQNNWQSFFVTIQCVFEELEVKEHATFRRVVESVFEKIELCLARVCDLEDHVASVLECEVELGT